MPNRLSWIGHLLGFTWIKYVNLTSLFLHYEGETEFVLRFLRMSVFRIRQTRSACARSHKNSGWTYFMMILVRRNSTPRHVSASTCANSRGAKAFFIMRHNPKLVHRCIRKSLTPLSHPDPNPLPANWRQLCQSLAMCFRICSGHCQALLSQTFEKWQQLDSRQDHWVV